MNNTEKNKRSSSGPIFIRPQLFEFEENHLLRKLSKIFYRSDFKLLFWNENRGPGIVFILPADFGVIHFHGHREIFSNVQSVTCACAL